jgi:hypothetical protein
MGISVGSDVRPGLIILKIMPRRPQKVSFRAVLMTLLLFGFDSKRRLQSTVDRARTSGSEIMRGHGTENERRASYGKFRTAAW